MANTKVLNLTAQGAIPEVTRESAFTRFVKWVEYRRARRQTLQELYALSDRQLNDLGFERGLLPELVDSRLQADFARIAVKNSG